MLSNLVLKYLAFFTVLSNKACPDFDCKVALAASKLASNIKEDRTSEDLLTQVILDLGLTLDLKIEEKNILNNKIYFVENNSLVACFDDNVNIDIIDEICKYNPLKVVFKDVSFKSDKDKIIYTDFGEMLFTHFGLSGPMILSASALVMSAGTVSGDEWTLRAENFLNEKYYGVTAANGMIGLVSSPEPFKVGETVLAGVYDYFGRGRVLNFLPNISPVNLELKLGGTKLNKSIYIILITGILGIIYYIITKLIIKKDSVKR